MARSDIKNLTDLNDYLMVLETRVAELENEDKMIKTVINEVNHDLQRTKQPTIPLPSTGLLSHNFFTRAFTVWGHNFFANLMISLISFFIYLLLFIIILDHSLDFLNNLFRLVIR